MPIAVYSNEVGSILRPAGSSPVRVTSSQRKLVACSSDLVDYVIVSVSRSRLISLPGVGEPNGEADEVDFIAKLTSVLKGLTREVSRSIEHSGSFSVVLEEAPNT